MTELPFNQDIAERIKNLPDFKNNQFGRGLALLMDRSPRFVHDSELWGVALTGVKFNFDKRVNSYFQDLRGLLKKNSLGEEIWPYQLRDFHQSTVRKPLPNGSEFLPEERSDLIRQITDPRAIVIADGMYPVYVSVSGDLLRSKLDAQNFTILHLLLKNPNGRVDLDSLRKKNLIKSSSKAESIKDAIDLKLRENGFNTRLSCTADTYLTINLK